VSIHFYYLINTLSLPPQDHLAPSLAARHSNVPSRNIWYGDGILFEMAWETSSPGGISQLYANPAFG